MVETSQPSRPPAGSHAGLWQRALAIGVDVLIINLVVALIGLALLEVTGERVRVASTNDSELAYADEFEAEEEALNERPLSQPNTNASAVMRDASAHQPKRAHPSRS